VHQEQLTQLLQGMAGAQVAFVASTQQQATDWLDRHRDGWDLTLIDLFLDRDHGYAILRHCRSRAPTQKVAVISDYSADPARARAMEEGADAFFEKAMEMPAMDCVLVGRRRRRRVAPGLHDSSDAAPLKSPGFRPPHASGASSRWGQEIRHGYERASRLLDVRVTDSESRPFATIGIAPASLTDALPPHPLERPMKTAEENLMDGLRGAHAAAGIAQTRRTCEAVRSRKRRWPPAC
jgi:CheY-like chemotaxis protein